MTILSIIPLACDGRPGRILKPVEDEDAFGVVREWDDAFGVFASIYPMASSQMPTEDGLEPAEQVRVMFNLPSGRTVEADDRLRVDGRTFRLSEIRDYGGTVTAVGGRL